MIEILNIHVTGRTITPSRHRSVELASFHPNGFFMHP